MKNKTRYTIIFIVLLLTFFLIYADTINLFGIMEIYFNSTKEEILARNILNRLPGEMGYNDISEINIFRHLLFAFSKQFTGGITEASSFLAIYPNLAYTVPFLAIFSAFSLIDKRVSINKFVYVRLREKQSYFNYHLKSILKESLSVALVVYASYCLYALYITVFYGFGLAPTHSTDFLANALTLKVFGNFGTIFFMVVSIFSVFLGTFGIVFFVCSIGYIIEEKFKLFLVVILYYFGLSFIMNAFGLFSPNIATYLSPLTIINPFAYPIKHSFLLIAINLIPFAIGYIIQKRGSMNYEIS